jgi:hypothetical protein
MVPTDSLHVHQNIRRHSAWLSDVTSKHSHSCDSTLRVVPRFVRSLTGSLWRKPRFISTVIVGFLVNEMELWHTSLRALIFSPDSHSTGAPLLCVNTGLSTGPMWDATQWDSLSPQCYKNELYFKIKDGCRIARPALSTTEDTALRTLGLNARCTWLGSFMRRLLTPK